MITLFSAANSLVLNKSPSLIFGPLSPSSLPSTSLLNHCSFASCPNIGHPFAGSPHATWPTSCCLYKLKMLIHCFRRKRNCCLRRLACFAAVSRILQLPPKPQPLDCVASFVDGGSGGGGVEWWSGGRYFLHTLCSCNRRRNFQLRLKSLKPVSPHRLKSYS